MLGVFSPKPVADLRGRSGLLFPSFGRNVGPQPVTKRVEWEGSKPEEVGVRVSCKYKFTAWVEPACLLIALVRARPS